MRDSSLYNDIVNSEALVSERQKEDIELEDLIEEIEMINDPLIKNFVRRMLLAVPEFWQIPSTFSESEGAPPDEFDAGGNVLHTKRVFRVVRVMLQSYELEDIDQDVILAAALLHALTKGIVMDGDDVPTFNPMYPYTVDMVYKQVNSFDEKYATDDKSSTTLVPEEHVRRILRIIRCQRGKWSPIPETFPLDEVEMLLHQADLIAYRLPYIVDGEKVKDHRWHSP